jgi:hypothetical protein
VCCPMSRLTSSLLISSICVLGLLAFLLGTSTVTLRFVHHEFPGGSLALTNNAPISLKPGTGTQYLFRRINSDSSVLLRCGPSDGATEKRVGYFTSGMHYYVNLEVDGCDLRKFDEFWFP